MSVHHQRTIILRLAFVMLVLTAALAYAEEQPGQVLTALNSMTACGSSDPRRFTDPTLCLRVLDELELPPISRDGDPFLRSTAPSHLAGDDAQSYRAYFVLAPNTNPYPFVVDASASLPGGPLVTFEWSYYVSDDNGDFFSLSGPSNSPYYTNQPPDRLNFNSREMVLGFTDPAGFARLWFGVVVLTPETATATISEWLDDHYDRRRGRVQRRLLPPLREAMGHFAAGETEAGKHALRRFQRRLKVTRYPLTRHEARVFKAFSQAILDTAAN